MNEQTDDEEDHPEDYAPAPVGYKRPPVQHQFPKGRSGNPNGRPRTKAARPANPSGPISLDSLILREANRPIELRENGRPVKMTVMEAAMRSIEASMLKGNHRAQEHFISLVKGAEGRERDLTNALRLAFDQMKERWRALCESHKISGLALPNPTPHPDDIWIDSATGRPAILGPVDGLERDQEEATLAILSEMEGRLSRIEIARQRNPAHAYLYREEFELGILLMGRIRDNFPDPDIRRSANFDFKVWQEDRNSRWRNLKRLDVLPPFSMAKRKLAKAGQLPLSWLGGDHLVPASWNVDDDDEMDFAMLATLWIKVSDHYDRLKQASPTTDWGPRLGRP